MSPAIDAACRMCAPCLGRRLRRGFQHGRSCPPVRYRGGICFPAAPDRHGSARAVRTALPGPRRSCSRWRAGCPSWPRGTGDGDSPARNLSAGMAGAGERLGPDDIGVSRVGRKSLTPGALAPSPRPLDTGLFHCHLLGQSSCPGPAAGAPRRVWVDRLQDGMSRGRHGAPPEGWACRWNLPQWRARHDSAAGSARGHGGAAGGRLLSGVAENRAACVRPWVIRSLLRPDSGQHAWQRRDWSTADRPGAGDPSTAGGGHAQPADRPRAGGQPQHGKKARQPPAGQARRGQRTEAVTRLAARPDPLTARPRPGRHCRAMSRQGTFHR